jgi:ribonuclease T2
MKLAAFGAAFLACFWPLSALAFAAQEEAPRPGQFDYYVLALSWAPNYCAGHPKDRSSECRPGQNAGFVLHGLWPQASKGRPPVQCGPARPVPHAVVRHMLQYFPSKGLIQHEWRQHGVCSGLSPAEYFTKVEQAFTALQVPEQYRSLEHNQNFSTRVVERSFEDANHAPPESFRISCRSGGALVNVTACLSKDLVYQACTASVHECRSPQVTMNSVK